MQWIDVQRMHTVATTALQKTYRYNRRFITPSPNVIGARYWIGDEPIFPRSDAKYAFFDGGKYSREYKTFFGPVFRSNSYSYTTDNDGLRGAVRRLTCVREPDIPGYHELLFDNQHRNIPLYDCQWLDHFQPIMREILNDVELDRERLRNLWCDAPHPKKSLRGRARYDCYYHGKDRALRVKSVNYKCKPGEVLAANKYLRAVGDLTTPGSTVGGYFMDFVKTAFERPYVIGEAKAVFVKSPKRKVMVENFANLIQPQGLHFCYFSDDSCLSAQCRDGILRCNMDISACDGSNFDPIFDTLHRGIAVDERFNTDVDNIFAQCKLKCKIRSDDGKYSVTLTPRYHTLYSGSVLTTSINNMANTMIFSAIANRYNPTISKAELVDAIKEAAEEVGFIVKVIVCDRIEEIQFLKHSPYLSDDGEVQYFLNIGTMLRSLGTCQGDLPGRTKDGLEFRARAFTSEVIRSFKHAGDSCVTEALRSKVIASRLKVKLEASIWRVDENLDSQFYVPARAIAQRYGIREDQVDELCHDIREVSFRQCLCSDILDKIFEKDYGY